MFEFGIYFRCISSSLFCAPPRKHSLGISAVHHIDFPPFDRLVLSFNNFWNHFCTSFARNWFGPNSYVSVECPISIIFSFVRFELRISSTKVDIKKYTNTIISKWSLHRLVNHTTNCHACLLFVRVFFPR